MIPFAAGGLQTEVTGPWWYTGGLIVALFAASFFFSGTETALFSLQKLDKQRLMTNPSRAEQQILNLLRKRTALITSILMGNETANIALTATTAAVVYTLAPGKPWLNVLVLTPALVLISEITPKVVALRSNVAWARLAIWPLTVFYWLVIPLRIIFSSIVSVAAKGLGVDSTAEYDGLEEEELLVLVGQSVEVDPKEREIIEAVFDFDELSVDRLMTPRPDIHALPITTPFSALMDEARKGNLSRIPIYSKRPDDIVGVLLVKDLLRHRKQPPRTPRQLYSMLLQPTFVPASKAADDMLTEFLQRKFHMAFVVDEHGTLVGLITLDDLLDELLGESEDSVDREVAEIHPHVLRVKAAIDLEDFEAETGIHVPQGEYHTLGGFVFHELGRLPRRGDAVETEEYRYVVAEMEARRISEIEVHTKLSNLEAG